MNTLSKFNLFSAMSLSFLLNAASAGQGIQTVNGPKGLSNSRSVEYTPPVINTGNQQTNSANTSNKSSNDKGSDSKDKADNKTADSKSNDKDKKEAKGNCGNGAGKLCNPADIYNRAIGTAQQTIDGTAGAAVSTKANNKFTDQMNSGQGAYNAANQAAITGYKTTEKQEGFARTRKISAAAIAGGFAQRLAADNKTLDTQLAAAQAEEARAYTAYNNCLNMKRSNQMLPAQCQNTTSYENFKKSAFSSVSLKNSQALEKRFGSDCSDTRSAQCKSAISQIKQKQSEVISQSAMVAYDQAQQGIQHQLALAQTKDMRQQFEAGLAAQGNGTTYDWGSGDQTTGEIGTPGRGGDGYSEAATESATDDLASLDPNFTSGGEIGMNPYSNPMASGIPVDPSTLGQNGMSGNNGGNAGALGGGGGGGGLSGGEEADGQAKALGGKSAALASGQAPKAGSAFGAAGVANPDLSITDMLKNMMGLGGEAGQEFAANNNDITQFGGERSLASDQSLLAKEVNIFERVSVAYQRKNQEGALK